VVDTIGLNAKTFVNNFRTPHTEKLHVVERFKLVDGGKAMQVDITFDDRTLSTRHGRDAAL